jgi:hypothetical protein
MKTKKQFEEYLNDLYSQDTLNSFETLEYLTNKIIDGKAGSVLRRLDSIAFEAGYNDWK